MSLKITYKVRKMTRGGLHSFTVPPHAFLA
jgi:hypothetical protein